MLFIRVYDLVEPSAPIYYICCMYLNRSCHKNIISSRNITIVTEIILRYCIGA